jgi:hypothetical protein
MSNQMIEPKYDYQEYQDKIPLTGRVFVFGSGKLIHENLFFDFSSAEVIRCYDPNYTNDSNKPNITGTQFTFHSELQDAFNGGAFDHIIAFFSLHYEPAWIPVLSRLLSGLQDQGMFYYAEDHGFRAALDGTALPSNKPACQNDIDEAFHQRHRTGGMQDKGSPWNPGIRASDYSQMATVLNLYGLNECEEPLCRVINRKPEPSLRKEATFYLPWKAGIDLLRDSDLPKSVQEIVHVHRFKRFIKLELPNSLLSESRLAEVMRSLILKHSTHALSQLALILPSSSEAIGQYHKVYSQLNTFGCAWLSIVYQNIARHIQEIEAIQLIFQRVGDHEEMIEALSAYDFEAGDPFLTCTKNAGKLEPWDYTQTGKYTEYVQKLSPELGYLAKPIFQTGTTGVYWDGNLATRIEANEHDSLTQEFSIRGVPSPCLYIPARLAHVEGNSGTELRPLTLIAMIVYFRDHKLLNETAWRNLHSLLLPLLDNVSAKIALGEMLSGHQHKRLLNERERSHKMLLKLQRPLDELTRAFGSVQAEAHEMQAILNSPEESLFRAHKLVADIFIDQKSIKVSDTLTAVPAHVPKELKDPDLQMLYVLVLCSIFGRRDELLAASSPVSVLGHGRDALREAERSPVFDDLCSLVRLVTEVANSRVSISETIDALHDESDDERISRQRRVLTRLKMLLFEPFKDFSNTYWPKAPFIIAVEGKQASLECLQPPPDKSDLTTRLAVRHDFSPFPQHGILDFILGAKGEFEKRASGHLFKKLEVGENTDKRSVLKIDYSGGTFFDSNKALNHFLFLRHAASHGVSGSNYGNFLGSYARLLRHAHSLEAGLKESPSGQWKLCDPNNPDISLAIQGSDNQRFFWIEHSHNNGKGTLSLVWSDKGWATSETAYRSSDAIVNVMNASSSAEVEAARIKVDFSTAPPTRAAESNEPTQCVVKCFVSDHNSNAPWATALQNICKIEGKRGTIEFVGVSTGVDRPSDVSIPEQVQVLILHTQDIEAWLNMHGSKYGIVRVSTQPESLTLPIGAPNTTTILENVFPSLFEYEAEHHERKKAESALLKSIFSSLAP